MNDKDLLEKILEKIKKTPTDLQAYTDLHHLCLSIQTEHHLLFLSYERQLSEQIESILTTTTDLTLAQNLYSLHKKVLLALAPYDFESYLLYVETPRDPDKKFYPPRRRILKQVVQALQDLTDDKIDLLTISMPPGTAKTTTAIFYLTWLAGRNPNEPILTGSHSNAFIRGVYDECLRIITGNGGEYLWSDVFPSTEVVSTNAKDCRIDLGIRQRFETLEFTSIGTGNAGLYRAAQLLYCDDLVSGIEVALSPDRLSKLWETYNTDLRQRKIGDHCKELHIATRWSLLDPIGQLQEVYENSDRAVFITIPAMDENDESNFNYDYGVGFSTEFYKEQREIMDNTNWQALYMNQPVDRTGILFEEDELQKYFDLPDAEPDAIIAACDTKDRGEDYCCLPVAYQYGDRYFIEDMVCNNGKPEIVDEQLIQMLMKHHVSLARFESNSAGGRVAKTVQEGVKERGGITHISTKFTTANKETKILTMSPWIKEHFLFKDPSAYPSKEYRTGMKQLCTYSMSGKVKHDDVADAMSQLAQFAQSLTGGKAEAFKRPW